MVTSTPLNLKAELARRGLTQRQVAEQMGINYTHLSRLINRRIPFTRHMARSFAMATGIPLRDIVKENGDA